MSEKEEAAAEAPLTPAEAKEIVLERLYTINLGKAYETIRKRRSKRAVTLVRTFIMRNMKVDDPADLTLDTAVNEYLWSRGIEKPPRRIRVRATKDKEDLVKVYLVEGQ
jgi:large subunit ribosomal protein L31e